MAEKSWVVMTGSSRGIGAQLRQQLRQDYNLILLNRSLCPKKEKGEIEISWDCSLSLNQNNWEGLKETLKDKDIAGFVHCAGQLGPMTKPSTSDYETYWEHYKKAMAVNFYCGVELCTGLTPFILKSKQRNKFLLHLSSGAAKNPYPAWEAYCSSKSAMLMHFRCLATSYNPDELLVLSIAPGTVMTDMMQSVLAADPSEFQLLSKFENLKEAGQLVNPSVPAERIAGLLRSSLEELAPLHGGFFDLRKGLQS